MEREKKMFGRMGNWYKLKKILSKKGKSSKTHSKSISPILRRGEGVRGDDFVSADEFIDGIAYHIPLTGERGEKESKEKEGK